MERVNYEGLKRDLLIIAQLKETSEKVPEEEKSKIKDNQYYNNGEIKEHSSTWIKHYQRILLEVYNYATNKYSKYERILESGDNKEKTKILDLSLEIIKCVKTVLEKFSYDQLDENLVSDFLDYFDKYFTNFILKKKFPTVKENKRDFENPAVLDEGSMTAPKTSRGRKYYKFFKELELQGNNVEEIYIKMEKIFSEFTEKIQREITLYYNSLPAPNFSVSSEDGEEFDYIDNAEDKKFNILESIHSKKTNEILLKALNICFLEKKNKATTEQKQIALNFLSDGLTNDNYRLLFQLENPYIYDFVSKNIIEEIDIILKNNRIKPKQNPISYEELANRYGYSNNASAKKTMNDFYKKVLEKYPDLEIYYH